MRVTLAFRHNNGALEVHLYGSYHVSRAAANHFREQGSGAYLAPLAVYLLSDAAKAVNAQVFAVRNNEIFLISQPRPLRSVHHADGWTPQQIAKQAMPALRASFVAMERSGDVFSWDPV